MISEAKETVGWVEKVIITAEEIEVKAKIDSGARHSSLHCGCKNFTKNNGEKWVRFTVRNYKDEFVEINKKVIRQARIRRHNGKMQVRDVIKLSICLGSVRKEVEVNLVNRKGLNFQMLIGRSFLKNDFLIDSGNKYINNPNCVI